MKFLLPFLFFTTFLCGSLSLHAQDIDTPVKYMDVISKQQENISKRYMAYTSASAHGKREKKVDALRSKLMDEIQEAKMNISSLPSYKGDKNYRDTAVNFLKFYYNVMNDDYTKIINMEEIAEQSYDEMEAYLLLEEKVQEKLTEANKKMGEAQKQFAAKNNINLIDGKSELENMMSEVTNLNKHYHDVYLIFFKPFIQEKYLITAVEKTNLTGVEQSKSAMVKYAQEGLLKLNTFKSYNGDNSLIANCTSMLNFYVKEGEKAAIINDYFLSKERFEAIKKEMDKKSDRTKESVDAYNKAVNEFNKSTQAYNTNNNSMNQLRNENLNNWNKAVKSFFDEHTPRYK